MSEHELQKACVNWFGYQYPKLKHLLIAIPNGGKRHPTVAKKMKAEGAKAGVPDLFLAKVVTYYEEFTAGLWIEMKMPKGVVRPNQKKYLEDLEEQGYAVAVCRSFEEFKSTIENYLNQ